MRPQANVPVFRGRGIQRARDGLGGLLTQVTTVARRVLRALAIGQRGQPTRQLALDQRTLDLATQVEAAVRGRASRDLARELVTRIARDEVDRTTEGVAAEICILRTAQDLHPLHVGGIHRRHPTTDEDAVDEDGARLFAIRALLRRHAAELDRALRAAARAIADLLREVEARREGAEVADRVDARLLELLCAQRRDRDRHLEHRLFALARGDRHFLEDDRLVGTFLRHRRRHREHADREAHRLAKQGEPDCPGQSRIDLHHDSPC